MKYKMKGSTEQDVIYTPGLPAALTQCEIPNAGKVFHATGDYGTQLFQGIEGASFQAWHINVAAKNNATLSTQAEQPVLDFHIALENDVIYSLEGIRKTPMREHQFNFTFTPDVEGKLELERDQCYQYLEIHPCLELLQPLESTFPALGKFLDRVAKGRATTLAGQNSVATPAMLMAIHRILKRRFQGEMQGMYLETKVFELMLLSLRQLPDVKLSPYTIVLNRYDIQRIQEAMDYLLANMSGPCSISWLARHLGINENKLRWGFKQQYGTTPFDFILEVRMERAKELLLKTDMTTEAIALTTGYSTVANFTTAFTKKFGYPPGFFKRGK